jgi:hypothetical protein
MIAAAVALVVITIIALIVAFTGSRKPSEKLTEPQIVSIETDPISGVEVETTTQEPETVSGPMFLGFEDLYRNRSGDWTNNAKETIKRFVATLGIDIERVSVAKGSFNNTGDNFDPLTSTTFYFAINSSDEIMYKMEAKTLPGAEYSYDIYSQAGEKLHSEIFKTAL